VAPDRPGLVELQRDLDDALGQGLPGDEDHRGGRHVLDPDVLRAAAPRRHLVRRREIHVVLRHVIGSGRGLRVLGAVLGPAIHVVLRRLVQDGAVPRLKLVHRDVRGVGRAGHLGAVVRRQDLVDPEGGLAGIGARDAAVRRAGFVELEGDDDAVVVLGGVLHGQVRERGRRLVQGLDRADLGAHGVHIVRTCVRNHGAPLHLVRARPNAAIAQAIVGLVVLGETIYVRVILLLGQPEKYDIHVLVVLPINPLVVVGLRGHVVEGRVLEVVEVVDPEGAALPALVVLAVRREVLDLGLVVVRVGSRPGGEGRVADPRGAPHLGTLVDLQSDDDLIVGNRLSSYEAHVRHGVVLRPDEGVRGLHVGERHAVGDLATLAQVVVRVTVHVIIGAQHQGRHIAVVVVLWTVIAGQQHLSRSSRGT